MSRIRRRLVVRVLVTALLSLGMGCTAAPVRSTYSQDDLRARCERTRGVWHTDTLMGGFCEYRAA